MECSAFEQELLAHQNGQELGFDARLHGDSCAHCRLLVRTHEALLTLIADEKQVQVSPFLGTRVMAHIQKREVAVVAVPVWKQALQVAAVVLALVGGYWGSVTMDERSATDDFSVVLTDYFLMDNAGLTIEDGWLYSETYEN
ncbi:MAG: hypothetical protein LC643_08405 [Bacteroidales bacterium]|nr:hypothetical protein [Bacteroidales bacterium]